MKKFCGAEKDDYEGGTYPCPKEWAKCIDHNPEVKAEYGRKFRISNFESGTTPS